MSVICDAHKKKVDVELLYNSVHRKFIQLEIRPGREDAGIRTCPSEVGSPGPQLSSPGERERNTVMAIGVGGQYVAVLFGLQLPLTVKPLVTLSNKVRGVFF